MMRSGGKGSLLLPGKNLVDTDTRVCPSTGSSDAGDPWVDS
jgi:hypothetical protein